MWVVLLLVCLSDNCVFTSLSFISELDRSCPSGFFLGAYGLGCIRRVVIRRE